MSEKNESIVDKLLDENNNENLKLYDEKNNCVEFEQVAIIPIQDRVYVILRPIAGVQGVEEDEAVVFSIEEVDDEECLIVVDDESIVDNVFAQYHELIKAEGIEV